MTDPWQQAFARFLDAAGPYLDLLVVAGGWASRLYRLSDRAIESDFVPLLTRDVDAVIPDRMPALEHGLNELMVASNFTEEPSSEFTPPVTRYVLDEPKGFEVEFLTNLPGGEYRRDGTPNATVAVAGVTALRLHYVGLLLVAPWTVTVRREDGYPVAVEEVSVRIPNPVSYVLQKLLIHKDRKGKSAKDVLYIHDTLEAFGDSEELLSNEWQNLRTQMPTKWMTRSRLRSVALRSPDHRHVVQAAMIARDAGRSVTADRIAGVLRAGLAFLDEE